MPSFEYKVVPAPMRGLKAKGVKGTPARFANALQTVMNDLGAQGWEYQRTDTLPVEERQGLTGKTTSFQNMLVFRRSLEADVADAPAVAALIEDQSAVVPEVEVEEQAADTVDHPSGDAEELISETDENEDGTDTPDVAAEERVNDTLAANFAFPWSKRQANPKAHKDDDPQHAAE